MEKENIIKQLSHLGINGKDAEAYIALLSLKLATALQLSRVTGIKRTTMYYCLESLIARGLVFEKVQDDKKYYLAEEPGESLVAIQQEQKRVIDNITPELRNLFGHGAGRPEIKVYHNVSGMKKIFDDFLKSKEKVGRYYISDFSLEDVLGEDFVNDFVKKRIKAGIKSLSLRSFKYKPAREKEMTNRDAFREVRFMPDEMIVKPYMCIYDNKVVVISTKEERTGFIIESKEFAEAQKIIFDMIWNKVGM